MSVVPVSGARLAPPDGLDDAERAEWVEIVDSLPASYFRPADIPLLAAYCTARAFYKEAAMQLKRDGLVVAGPDRYNKEGDVIGKDRDYAHPATGILVSQASALATLASKLRLCPSSRYSEKAASTKTESVGARGKPWESSASAPR